jgi:tetratricopeptide (TPR) repeat protein
MINSLSLKNVFVKGFASMRRCTEYIPIFSICIIFMLTLSCSTGYNKHADEYFEEGLLFYANLDYDRAIENFNKVLELAPYGEDNNIIYYNRGMAHLKIRQYDKSIYDFTKALELTSGGDKKLRFDIFVFRGNAYQKNNEFDYAVKDYSAAIQLNPRHKDIKFVYRNKASTWFAKGDYERAIDNLTKAIKIDPKFDLAYYERARAWFKKDDFQRALIDAKEAVKLVPANQDYNDLLFEIKSSMKK